MMSPTDPNMAGIKGKRIPGRPGRFDPTEPLHMTTRRAAKTGPNNGSPSINGSIDGDESRRGSLDDSRPFTSHSNESQFSINNRRHSEVSFASIDPEIATNGLFIPEEKPSGESMSIPPSPDQQTPSPSRKRKRSSSPAAQDEIQRAQPLESTEGNSFENDADDSRYEVEGDTVELVAPEDLSDREESQHSSHSYEEDDQPNDAFPDESMDITPAVSNPGSPQSGESESPEKRSLEGTLEDVAQEAQDETAEVVDEMDVDVDVDADVEVDADVDAEGPDDADDGEEQLRSDEDERPVRRFGGRRRAQHPIPKVEKAMQRQAELKSAYRALARAQKAVLAEIAQRTVDDLESNPELHYRTFEYQGVKEGLDDALEERQYRLRAQLELNMEQLKETLESQQRAVKERFTQKLRDLKEDRLAELEHKMMRIVREAQKTSLDDGYLTDNEDGITSKPKAKALDRKARSFVETVFDSHSRMTLETIRNTDDMENRFEMHKMLEELAEEDRVDRPIAFTAMDDTPRKAASARREGLEATKVLAEAAKEFEKRSKKPVLPNKDAFGLQLLGDLASRPSIKAPTRDYTQGKQRKSSMSQQTPSRPLPPQLQIPTNHRPSPIPVEMSPRTTQAMGDRFENSMPPPMTPRQRPNLFMRSPEVARPEQTLPSPTVNQNRFSGSHEYPVRTPDRWPDPRRTTYSDYVLTAPEYPKQSEQRHGPQQSPIQSGERRMEYPLWREYPRESPAVQHRRSSSHNERPPFSLTAGLPAREEKRDTVDYRMQNRQEGQDRSHGLPLSRPSYWQNQPSQPGATNNQSQDQRSPIEPSRRPTMEAQPQSAVRNSSLSFTPREFQPGGLLVKDSNQHEQKYRGFKSIFQHKTSKEERDGLSRRNWSNQQRRLSKSVGNFRPAGSPPRTSSAGSPPSDRAQPSAPWNAPPAPQHSPSSVPPPPQPGPYQPQPYSQPPPPPSYRPTQQSQDYYQHRTTFTPRPASSNQDRLPPTPLYVVPQSQPPPPGVPPEQYNRPFAPPPPPGYQPPPPPPPPPQGSQSAYPPSSSGTSFSNQYGGPPLAPAGTAYHPLGARQPPAFAQQAQNTQQQGSFGNRRRTQSDASQLPKFQPWTPPSRR